MSKGQSTRHFSAARTETPRFSAIWGTVKPAKYLSLTTSAELARDFAMSDGWVDHGSCHIVAGTLRVPFAGLVVATAQGEVVSFLRFIEVETLWGPLAWPRPLVLGGRHGGACLLLYKLTASECDYYL